MADSPSITVTREDLTSPGGLIALLTMAAEAHRIGDPDRRDRASGERAYQLAGDLLVELGIGGHTPRTT